MESKSVKSELLEFVIGKMAIEKTAEDRIGFLVKALSMNLKHLCLDQSKALINGIVKEFYPSSGDATRGSAAGNVYFFVRDLKKYLTESEDPQDKFVQTGNNFLLALSRRFDGVIVSTRIMDRGTSELFYDGVEFLYRTINSVNDEENRGDTNRLVRVFAERCDLELLRGKIKELRDNESADQKFFDALSDGYNKRIGSSKVACLHVESEDEVILAEIEKSLRDSLRVYRKPTDTVAFDKCMELFDQLSKAHKDGTSYAMQVVEEEKGDGCGEIFVAKLSKPIGQKCGD